MEALTISFATPLVVIHQRQADGGPAPVFLFQIGNYKFEGENMASTMQAGTYATCSVTWKDKSGNIVKVDGPTKWDSSSTDLVQCTGAPGNPQIANLYAPGPIGNAQVQATADADLGEGVKTVTATIDVTVIGGQAIEGDIEFTQSPAQGGGGQPGGGQPAPPIATPKAKH